MKKLTPLIAIALILSIQSSAQKKQTKQPSVTKIELSSTNWTYQEGKVEFANYKGRVKDVPERDHVGLPVEENMIVEYYSR